MFPAKRVVVAAVGALAALALAGCGTQYGKTQPVAKTTDAAAATTSPAPAAPVVKLTSQLIATTIPQMGAVVTDSEGWVLYRFDKDTANPSKSNCEGTCAQIWPPAYTDGSTAVTGIAADKVGSVTRSDGTKQLTIGGWPVYRYSGDLKPGQWKGQGVGGTWFVVAPDGKKNLTCLPTGTPTAVAPPTTAPAAAADPYSY